MKNERLKIIIWILLGLLILFILLPNSPWFRKTTSEDSGMFLYHGQQILQGRVPYRDVWEHKGPVILYINALGLLIGNGSRWGVWFLEFLFIFGAFLLGFTFLKKTFGMIPSLFAVILGLVSLILVLDGGNIPEEYNIFFQFLTLYLFWKSESKNFYGWRGFIIGVIGALSFLLKQNLIGIFISIVLFLLIKRMAKKEWQNLVKELLLIFSGFAVTVFGVFLYFSINKSLYFILDGFFRFNLIYSSSGILSKFKAIYMGLWILARSGLSFVGMTAWIVGVIFLLTNKKKSDKLSPLIFLGLIGLPIELIFAGAAGIHPPHYFIPLLPVLTVLAGFFAYYLIDKMKSSTQFLLVFLLSLVILPINVAFYELRPDKNPNICKDIGEFVFLNSGFFECSDTKIKISEYVKSITSKEDYVLIWGFGGSINFTSERKSPTRFTYQYPLFFYGYQSKALAEELVNDIIKNKPKVIIDTTLSTSRVPPLSPQKRKGWSEGIILPEMERLFEYIENNYRYEKTIGQDQWMVYKYIKK